MSITLNRFTGGMTDYITKHNLNCSQIEALVNPMQADVDALKAAGAAGADLDFRMIAFNMLTNGAFDYWQRGVAERPDGWIIRNEEASFGVTRESSSVKLNTYSLKTTGEGQLTQDFPEKIVAGIDTTSSFAIAAYVKTDAASQARIGVYDGVTTQYSNYHSGGGAWELLTKNVIFSSAPSSLRIVLDSAAGVVYFNALVAIRGNPASGAIFIANDPTLEQLRVLSIYELGSTNIRGVGFLNGLDRELETRIEFTSPKRAIPIVTVEDTETGFDYLAYNIDQHGFNLLVTEIGGVSGVDGFEVEDIGWIAEVSGT